MKNKSLANFLISLFFIALPALIGFVFYLPEINGKNEKVWIYYVAALGFIIYSIIIIYLFVYFKISNLNLITLAFPLSLVLSIIFVSSNWHIALRIVSVILIVVLAFPINMLTEFIRKKTSWQ